MFENFDDLPEGVIGMRVKGKVTEDDYKKVLVPILEETLAQGERVNFIFVFDNEFEAFTPGAAWQDMRIGLQYLRLFSKIAIVSDKDWLIKSASFLGSILPTPIKTYPLKDFGDAMTWVSQKKTSKLKFELLVDKGVLLIEPDRPLESEDFDDIAMLIDPWIEQEKQLKGLMIKTEKFPGWNNLGSMFRHLQFVSNHHKRIRRVAICAEGAIANLIPQFASFFVNAEIKHFSLNESIEALTWSSKK